MIDFELPTPIERQVQQLGARRPEERGAAATRSDLDAFAGQLRGEIRDVARALKDVQSPLPRILAMTRDVREAMTGIQTSQGQTSAALHRLEQASESLAITTDYLVVLAEEDEGDDDAFAEDEDEGVQAADAGVKGTESAASTEGDGAPGAGDGQPTSPDSWQAEFKRIEEAWLAESLASSRYRTSTSPLSREGFFMRTRWTAPCSGQ